MVRIECGRSRRGGGEGDVMWYGVMRCVAMQCDSSGGPRRRGPVVVVFHFCSINQSFSEKR